MCFAVCTACVILNKCVIKELQRRPSANLSLKQRLNRKEKVSPASYSDAYVTTRWHSHFTPQTQTLSHINTHAHTVYAIPCPYIHPESSNQPSMKEKVKERNNLRQTDGKKKDRNKKTKLEHIKQRKNCALTHKQWSNCSHHSWLLGDPCCHGK